MIVIPSCTMLYCPGDGSLLSTALVTERSRDHSIDMYMEEPFLTI